jgi:hypothetical protein
MKLLQNLAVETGPEMELSMNNELRVPKREVEAEVTFLFDDKRPRACVFFLSYYSPQRHGEESLAEYLDSQSAFLPLREKSSGEFFIVHVDQVMTVREPAPAAEGAGKRLRLVLENGGELVLRACEPHHAWRARPIDLLNEPGRFAAFSDEGNRRVHVNKRFIARVEGL